MSLGLIQGLCRKNPDVLLDVLVVPWCQEVYHSCPDVRQTILLPVSHGQAGLGIRWRLARDLKCQNYDEAYILPNSWKSALIPFLARIPKRIGYWGECRVGLLTHGITRPKDLSLLIQQYQYLADLPQEPIEPRLRVVLGDETAIKMGQSWGIQQNQPILAICPGAEYGPAKRWPTHYYAQLLDHYNQKGWQGVVLGSPKDQEVALDIVQKVRGRVVNLAGQTSLRQAMEILSLARLVVTNDSGLMHVAAGLDRPTIALFGSSSPTYTPPLSRKARILYQGVKCSPCFQRQCPLTGADHLHCLTSIKPEHVYQIYESMERSQ